MVASLSSEHDVAGRDAGDRENAGRFGVVIILIGLALWSGLSAEWMGRLPGDIRIERGNFDFYFPIRYLHPPEHCFEPALLAFLSSLGNHIH